MQHSPLKEPCPARGCILSASAKKHPPPRA
jgi:hypothetical protein